MEDNIAIKVENLSKVYKIFNKPIDRVKESLNIFGKRYSKDFYALNDISFEIKKGESVGIVGKNGAGKSTLLKIITGVLVHSSGIVKVNGKVSALLELGAGFNPEFTGIENIYLNGTIMGYSREEIEEKIESVIEFADIGDFIYQPVKMYSSGMFARLAFAVAINVDPDILIVDEALSVGDIAFQYKCFQKMKELKEKGVTLILVTHSTQQLLQNCDRAILLSESEVIMDSYDVNSVIVKYEKIMRNLVVQPNEDCNYQVDEIIEEDFDTSPNKEIGEVRMGTYKAIFRDVYISNDPYICEKDTLLECGKKSYLNFVIYSKEDILDVIIGVALKNKEGINLWLDNNLFANKQINIKKGKNKICYEFIFNLVPGDYLFCCGMVKISNGIKEDLDHRWPIKIVKAVSLRHMDGIVYSPITVK